MKQIATPIIPQTSVVGTADKAIETAFKAADTALETAYKAADKTISDTVASNKTATDTKLTALDNGVASAIAQWDGTRQFRADQITIRNRTFFYALKDNINKDPLTDTAGNWSIFVPNEANSIFANRSPVSSDVQPAGVKWYDVSFGADSPLILVSLGNGAWQYLNQITLSRVRFYVSGINSTYQSNLNSIKFFKKDGTQMPYGWWVWGARSGLGGQNAGSNYTGQSMGAAYNASGWGDLEPSSSFDLGESITKVTGSTGYANVTKVEFYYSNGGMRTFTPGGGNLATCDPVLPARIGDSVVSVLGETLTAAKLTNAASIDPGRVTGAEFTSAWNALYQAKMGLESTTNANYLLSSSPYTAASAVGLRGLVHIRSDGTIEPADDTVANKPANGIVDAPIAAGASGNVYGTGVRFSAVGLSGTQPGSQLFTGSTGNISLSSIGNGRLIQQVGIFKSNLYYFDFSDPGYWIEAL